MYYNNYVITNSHGGNALFMFDSWFQVRYWTLLGGHVFLWEISEGGMLRLGEELVVIDFERLVGGLGETSLQVVLDHHGTREVNLGHVHSRTLHCLGHLIFLLSILFS